MGGSPTERLTRYRRGQGCRTPQLTAHPLLCPFGSFSFLHPATHAIHHESTHPRTCNLPPPMQPWTRPFTTAIGPTGHSGYCGWCAAAGPLLQPPPRYSRRRRRRRRHLPLPPLALAVAAPVPPPPLLLQPLPLLQPLLLLLLPACLWTGGRWRR